MDKLLALLISALTLQANAQTFYTTLNGFKLGQYRETTRNEFGNPFQSGKYDDGFQYDIFLLKPDTSLYMIFEYAANDTESIWSIQVTGSDARADIGFENMKLGMEKAQIEKVLGVPSSQEDVGTYGHRWVYDKRNFSVEVNTKGKLSSVKIIDKSDEFFPVPQVEKIPTFDKVKNALCSNDNETILNLLTGDIEIYKGDSTYYFKKSVRTEQSKDYSKVLAIIKSASKDLGSVDVKNPDEYEVNGRLTLGMDLKHVIKIKKGHAIREIVMKYTGGEYRIFEIRCRE
jgi:hypothetical protein